MRSAKWFQVLVPVALLGGTAALVSAVVGCESTTPAAESSEGEDDFTAANSCGGFAGWTCSGGKICVDDPVDSCDPNKGGADCMGLCVTKSTTKKCGGFAGLQCATGYNCVDDPTDSCNPGKGGADCGGLCVKSACNPKFVVTMTCAKGTQFDLAKCACVAPCDANKIKTTTCASGMHFDTLTCGCVKECELALVKTVTCGTGKHFDAKQCACVK